MTPRRSRSGSDGCLVLVLAVPIIVLAAFALALCASWIRP